MHETRFFDQSEKNKMYDLYRRLMDYNRQSIEFSLEHNDKDKVEFINNILNEWGSLRKELLKFVKKMRASWSIDTDIKEDIGYLG